MAGWYQIALEKAIENHDPDGYEGRVWAELDIIEQEAAILAAGDKLTKTA